MDGLLTTKGARILCEGSLHHGFKSRVWSRECDLVPLDVK
jgi:hypothetical protein